MTLNRPPPIAMVSARTELVSVIEMGLRGTTRKFQGLLTLVANHCGITAGLSSATVWGNHTRADR